MSFIILPTASQPQISAISYSSYGVNVPLNGTATFAGSAAGAFSTVGGAGFVDVVTPGGGWQFAQGVYSLVLTYAFSAASIVSGSYVYVTDGGIASGSGSILKLTSALGIHAASTVWNMGTEAWSITALAGGCTIALFNININIGTATTITSIWEFEQITVG